MRTESSDTIDLADVARAIGRGWWAVVLFAGLGTLAGVAVLRWAPRKFTGAATLVLKAPDGGSSSVLSAIAALGGGGAGAGPLSGVAKTTIETEAQVLASRSVVGQVVDSLMLQAHVVTPRGFAPGQVVRRVHLPGAFKSRRYQFVRSGNTGEYSVRGEDSTTTKTHAGVATLPVGEVELMPDATLPAELTLELSDLEDATTRVEKHLTVNKPGGDVASIDYRGDDSLTAARVPNMMLAVYLERRRTTDRGVNQRRVEYLTQEMNSLSTQLSAAEDALRGVEQSSGVIDPTTVSRLELEQTGDLRAKAVDIEVEAAALQQNIDQVAAGTMTATQLAAFPTFLKSPGVNALLSDLSTVESERYKALAARTENDATVQRLTESAHNLEGKFMPLAHAYVATLNKQLADIDHELDSAQKTLATMPTTAESTARLQRQVLQLGTIYGAMRGQLVDARLAAIGEGGDVHPLDFAVPPKKPSFPTPVTTLAVGLAGGLFCGLIMAIIVGGRLVRDPRDIERSAGVPALRFDPAVPLVMNGASSRTILVAPIDSRSHVGPVVKRLIQTATSRGLTATLLDLSGDAFLNGFDAHTTVARLEGDYDLVVVSLPGIVSDAAVATMRAGRPVLLVTPGRRINRSRLNGAVELLRRLDVPCAGVVMSGEGGNGVVG